MKCDRGQPSCGWCVRNSQVCEYKERKKPGLRAGYGRELEARLGMPMMWCEWCLAQRVVLSDLTLERWTRQTRNHHRDAATSPAASRQCSTGTTVTDSCSSLSGECPLSTCLEHGLVHADAGHVSHCRRHTVQPAPGTGRHEPSTNSSLQSTDIASIDTNLPQTQASQPHRASQHSIHLPSTTAADIYAPSNPPLESPSLNISVTAGHDAAMKAVSQDQDFPPYDLLYALTGLFFNHINTWCPILHRRSTVESLFGTNALEEADRVLLHAIVATTLRFSTDPRLSDQARERYHTVSKQKVLLYGLENSSVKALQALVILALDTVGSSNGPPGWNLLALITRSVVQLGLAVETSSTSVAPLFPSIYTLRAMVLPEPKSFIEDESRRRLLWMVYLLDRYATIATAFDFALDDREIDRKLPCRDDLFARNQPVDTRWFQTMEGVQHHLGEMNQPENLGSFSYYIEIIGILSQIHRFLKKPVDISALSDVEQWQQEYRQLDGKLNQWKFSLPSEYGNMSRLFNSNGSNTVVNCIWIMLHITYHT